MVVAINSTTISIVVVSFTLCVKTNGAIVVIIIITINSGVTIVVIIITITVVVVSLTLCAVTASSIFFTLR